MLWPDFQLPTPIAIAHRACDVDRRPTSSACRPRHKHCRRLSCLSLSSSPSTSTTTSNLIRLTLPPSSRSHSASSSNINQSIVLLPPPHNNNRYHEVLCCPHLRRRDHCRGPEHVRPPPVRRKSIPRSTVHVSCIVRSHWRDTNATERDHQCATSDQH